MSQEHNVVSVSGGKDSTALLLLAIERDTPNLQAVFADTGHEHPQTYEYLQYLEKVTGVAIRWVKADFTQQIAARREMMQRVIDGTHKNRGKYEWTIEVATRALEVLQPTGNPFLDMCLVHGRFPSTKVRFCSSELKREPMMQQVQLPLLSAGHDVVSWQGVRADESSSRALLSASEHSMTHEGGGELWNYRPILNWTADECFAMHRKHGIEHNPLYAQGMGRVGCMPCIHVRKDELLEISKRFPEEIDRVELWEALVRQVSKTDSATFFPASELGAANAAEARPDKHGIRAKVEWSKTSRGKQNLDIFRVDDRVELCSSIYGLCE
ncbi:phosphoadenosine phosphosulfate reductase [Pseudomonas fulva]|uniref:phosphoadenosine phosphosulfate reductase domain-containing protein n=1 Tax=Pseudomonas fulva TaxID=47880 RepID=UPI000F77D9CF|nr:phosphoadenosine phosphosulfate reductase family protein [Pseudomonas fulva]RRW59529.1 phosphoadenosine phosphosulfate reductase [Pseudomonas fulva]